MINIVLVEPRIPQNVGNIARTCAATGSPLHLIEPMGFEIEDKKLKRAGLDYWHLMEIYRYSSTEEFFSKKTGEFFFFSTKASCLYTKVCYSDNCYLVFGREDAGLPESILNSGMGKNVRIPMVDKARSLNLSNAVAISVYEAIRQLNFGLS
jgi:tRNA (cytidine/uridine-2'-O-)-methyltransferase